MLYKIVEDRFGRFLPRGTVVDVPADTVLMSNGAIPVVHRGTTYFCMPSDLEYFGGGNGSAAWTEVRRCPGGSCPDKGREAPYAPGLGLRCVCGRTMKTVRWEARGKTKSYKLALPQWAAEEITGERPTSIEVFMYAPCTDAATRDAIATTPRGAVEQIGLKALGAAVEGADLALGKDLDGWAPKVALLFHQIGLAQQRLESSERDLGKALKTFIVPEWFFRKHETTDHHGGHYTRDDAIAIVGALCRASGLERYADWLIVAGSIRWQVPITSAAVISGDKPVTMELIDVKKSYCELNTAVVVSGGKLLLFYYKRHNGGDTEHDRLSKDRLKSNEPYYVFLTDPYTFKPTGFSQVVPRWELGIDVPSALRPPVFTHRGLKMGLDVCADYGYTEEAPCLLKDIASKGWSGLDVHFVIACDVNESLEAGQTCDARGLLLCCDGGVTGSKCFTARRRKSNGESLKLQLTLDDTGPIHRLCCGSFTLS